MANRTNTTSTVTTELVKPINYKESNLPFFSPSSKSSSSSKRLPGEIHTRRLKPTKPNKAKLAEEQETEFNNKLAELLSSAKKNPKIVNQVKLIDHVSNYLSIMNFQDGDTTAKVQSLRDKLESELSNVQLSHLKKRLPNLYPVQEVPPPPAASWWKSTWNSVSNWVYSKVSPPSSVEEKDTSSPNKNHGSPTGVGGINDDSDAGKKSTHDNLESKLENQVKLTRDNPTSLGKKRALPTGIIASSEIFLNEITRTSDYYRAHTCSSRDLINPALTNIVLVFCGQGLTSTGGYNWGTQYRRIQLYPPVQLVFLDPQEKSVEDISSPTSALDVFNKVACKDNDNFFDIIWGTDRYFKHLLLNFYGNITIPPYLFYNSSISNYYGIDVARRNNKTLVTVQYPPNINLFRSDPLTKKFNNLSEIVQSPTVSPTWASTSLGTDESGGYSVGFSDDTTGDLLIQKYNADDSKAVTAIVASNNTYYSRTIFPKEVSGNPIPMMVLDSNRLNPTLLIYDNVTLRVFNTIQILTNVIQFYGTSLLQDINSCGPSNPDWFPVVFQKNDTSGMNIAFNLISRTGNLALPQDMLVNEIMGNYLFNPQVRCKGYIAFITFHTSATPTSTVSNIKGRVLNFASLLGATPSYVPTPIAVLLQIPQLNASSSSFILSNSTVQGINVDQLTIQNIINGNLTNINTGQLVTLPYTANIRDLLNGSFRAMLNVTGLNSSQLIIDLLGCNTTLRMCTPSTSSNISSFIRPYNPFGSLLNLTNDGDPNNSDPNLIFIIAGVIVFVGAGGVIGVIVGVCKSKCYQESMKRNHAERDGRDRRKEEHKKGFAQQGDRQGANNAYVRNQTFLSPPRHLPPPPNNGQSTPPIRGFSS